MSKRKGRWVCEEGTKNIPLDFDALKQYQPQPERQEGKHGAGGARTGREKESLSVSPAPWPKQAGQRVAAARNSPFLPSFRVHI